MKTYKVLAQSYTTAQRIQRTVQAARMADVLLTVSAELDDAGLYPISITETAA